MASTLADINSQIKKHDEQIAQLRKQAEELRNQERAGVVEELRKKIAEYGLTAADLKLGGARRQAQYGCGRDQGGCKVSQSYRRNLVGWPRAQAALDHGGLGCRQVAVGLRDQVDGLRSIAKKSPRMRAFLLGAAGLS